MNVYMLVLVVLGLTTSCQGQQTATELKTVSNMKFTIDKSDEEWRKSLTPEQYYVLRQKGTERPHSGQFNLFFEDGTYKCAACSAPLFTSESKFNAHCGWPSFDRAIADTAIIEVDDMSHGMVRTEILCRSCGGHLGHVFNDGPTETGLRYCVNSVSIEFSEASKEEKENLKK